jgi:hypothetical protein
MYTQTLKYFWLAIDRFLPFLEELKKKAIGDDREKIIDIIEAYKEIKTKIDSYNLNYSDPNRIDEGELSEVKNWLDDKMLENLGRLTLRLLISWKEELVKIEGKIYKTEANKEREYELKNLIWPLEALSKKSGYIVGQYADKGPLIFPGEVQKNNITTFKKDISTEEAIEKGENDFIEFKSSTRWDYKESKINKDLEYVIAKTISAFLNSEGGKLLIGVNDNGEIIGIENDYNTLSIKNYDKFSLNLIEIINSYLGKKSNNFIFTHKETIQSKEICIVDVNKSDTPIYIKHNGQEEFFIRAGASSQPLNIREASEYIKSHWKV